MPDAREPIQFEIHVKDLDGAVSTLEGLYEDGSKYKEQHDFAVLPVVLEDWTYRPPAKVYGEPGVYEVRVEIETWTWFGVPAERRAVTEEVVVAARGQ